MMKKTRIFAGLAALLLCFQTGIRLNANAVTLAPTEEETQEETLGMRASDVRNQISNFIHKKNLFYIRCESYFSYETPVIIVAAFTPQYDVYDWEKICKNLDTVKNYCEEQGFMKDFDIRFTAEENGQQKIAEQINQFAETNDLNYITSTADNGIIRVAAYLSRTELYSYSPENQKIREKADSQLETVRMFCQEQGFTEKYAFNFTTWVSDEEKTTDDIKYGDTEIDITVKAGDLNLNDKLDILDVITLNKAILGKEKLNPVQELAADANKDDKIDASDSLAIMKAIVGILEKASDKQLSSASVNLSKSVKSDIVEGKAADDTFIQAQTSFYLHLFQKAEQKDADKNILVSPYSVMQALAMTANGADGQTLEEMEQTLGGLSLNDLNQYLYTQRNSQPNTAKCSLSTANSIWYRDFAERFEVLPDFLKTNADYYAADAYKAPFDDSTITDINTWVSNKTDRMIPEVLNPEEPIDPNTLMYLINAVTFDAKWQSPYDSEYQVHDGKFTALDGSEQTVSMMSSEEHAFLHDDSATGFYKYYDGRRYAFAALLPNEGISVDEYISGLTAESLQNTLSHPQDVKTYTKMPKFSYDYKIQLKDTLCEMGMPTAFDANNADFTRMAEMKSDWDILHIDAVLHKTHIDVTEEGTRAAAVTVVQMDGIEAVMEYQEVNLDRPFVYMIVDMENHLPVFMGTVKSVES